MGTEVIRFRPSGRPVVPSARKRIAGNFIHGVQQRL